MKILLDENIDARIKGLFVDHQVVHVQELQWKGGSNGALLTKAEDSSFHVFITADKNLVHQQNLASRNIAIIVLDIHPNTRANEEACIPDALNVLKNLEPGKVAVVEGPHPKREGP